MFGWTDSISIGPRCRVCINTRYYVKFNGLITRVSVVASTSLTAYYMYGFSSKQWQQILASSRLLIQGCGQRNSSVLGTPPTTSLAFQPSVSSASRNTRARIWVRSTLTCLSSLTSLAIRGNQGKYQSRLASCTRYTSFGEKFGAERGEEFFLHRDWGASYAYHSRPVGRK